MWDVEMQTVADVMSYFCGVKVEEIDVGMVKKLWQLLRNETVEWIQSFLRDGGFAVILAVLKDVLAIEWRFVSTRPALPVFALCAYVLGMRRTMLFCIRYCFV